MKLHDLDNQRSPLIASVIEIQADDHLNAFKNTNDINRVINSSMQDDSFAIKMEKRLLKVKEVCSKYHKTYDGR